MCQGGSSRASSRRREFPFPHPFPPPHHVCRGKTPRPHPGAGAERRGAPTGRSVSTSSPCPHSPATCKEGEKGEQRSGISPSRLRLTRSRASQKRQEKGRAWSGHEQGWSGKEGAVRKRRASYGSCLLLLARDKEKGFVDRPRGALRGREPARVLLMRERVISCQHLWLTVVRALSDPEMTGGSPLPGRSGQRKERKGSGKSKPPTSASSLPSEGAGGSGKVEGKLRQEAGGRPCQRLSSPAAGRTHGPTPAPTTEGPRGGGHFMPSPPGKCK